MYLGPKIMKSVFKREDYLSPGWRKGKFFGITLHPRLTKRSLSNSSSCHDLWPLPQEEHKRHILHLQINKKECVVFFLRRAALTAAESLQCRRERLFLQIVLELWRWNFVFFKGEYFPQLSLQEKFFFFTQMKIRCCRNNRSHKICFELQSLFQSQRRLLTQVGRKEGHKDGKKRQELGQVKKKKTVMKERSLVGGQRMGERWTELEGKKQKQEWMRDQQHLWPVIPSAKCSMTCLQVSVTSAFSRSDKKGWNVVKLS